MPVKLKEDILIIVLKLVEFNIGTSDKSKSVIFKVTSSKVVYLKSDMRMDISRFANFVSGNIIDKSKSVKLTPLVSFISFKAA